MHTDTKTDCTYNYYVIENITSSIANMQIRTGYGCVWVEIADIIGIDQKCIDISSNQYIDNSGFSDLCYNNRVM